MCFFGPIKDATRHDIYTMKTYLCQMLCHGMQLYMAFLAFKFLPSLTQKYLTTLLDSIPYTYFSQ